MKQDIMVTNNQMKPEQSLQIHKELVDLAHPFLEEKFQNFNVFASHFVVKKAKSQTSFQLHQDWNATDEQKSKSLKVWVPLTSSFPENGGLCFIPQSHRFYNNYRSGSLGIPQFEITENLHPYLSYLRLFPGEAALFYNHTLHGSFINSTDENRIGVIFNLIEKDAQALYYHKTEKGQIESYPLTTKSLFENLSVLEKGELPHFGDALDCFDAKIEDYTSWTEKDLIEQIHSINIQSGRALNYENKLYRIIKNKDLETLINKQGYAIIDLLDATTIDLFRAKFWEIYPDRSKYSGLYSSMMHVPHEERKKLHDFTMDALSLCLEKYVENYASPISLFYSRRPDKEYYLEWHSDPSILLNQHLEPLYGVWFPLLDLNPKSG
ncbi:MAG: phytanoyl-CoA dioxygenase family protein, partial [Candidatus Paceibacterota bacterium]